MTEQEKFFNKLYDAAPANMHGLYYSVMLAQAAIESSFGKSWLASQYNNYFGIKANSTWKGKRVNAYTHEYVNGDRVGQYSDFRAYDNIREGVADYVNFLRINSRYSKVGLFDAKTPEEAADCLQKAGYATSPTYAATIKKYINTYNLNKYDKKKAGKIIPLLLSAFGIFYLVKKLTKI